MISNIAFFIIKIMIISYQIDMNCTGYNIRIPVMQDYTKSIDRYKEGIFYNFIFKDTSSISIHCGYNVKRPLNGNVLRGDTLHINGLYIIRYQGKKNKLYFIEDYYIESEITILAQYLHQNSFLIELMNKIRIKKLKE